MTDAIKKAKLFIKKLNENGISVDSAYIFGSYAKGTANENSDIDLCVISNSFGKDYIEEMVNLRKISLGIDSRIEPVPFNLSDINDPYSSLAKEIIKNGINISI